MYLSTFGILTDIDMLFLVQKYIRDRLCHPIHRYVKDHHKYMKDYDETKESSYINY